MAADLVTERSIRCLSAVKCFPFSLDCTGIYFCSTLPPVNVNDDVSFVQ